MTGTCVVSLPCDQAPDGPFPPLAYPCTCGSACAAQAVPSSHLLFPLLCCLQAGSSCKLDNTKNGDETDVDCGGPKVSGMAASMLGPVVQCLRPASLACPCSRLTGPTCVHGPLQCPKCADGKACLTGSDCQSGICEGSPLKCQVCMLE